MNNHPKENQQKKKQGLQFQEFQYQAQNYSFNEYPDQCTMAGQFSLDDQNSDSLFSTLGVSSPHPDIDYITPSFLQGIGDNSMSRYMQSPYPVENLPEDNVTGASGGGSCYEAQRFPPPDHGMYRDSEKYSSDGSSPRTEDDMQQFRLAGTSSRGDNLTKDGRTRQRAPKKYRVDFSDDESYQVYKRLMDKNRQQKKRDKLKKKKNDEQLFPPNE